MLLLYCNRKQFIHIICNIQKEGEILIQQHEITKLIFTSQNIISDG